MISMLPLNKLKQNFSERFFVRLDLEKIIFFFEIPNIPFENIFHNNLIILFGINYKLNAICLANKCFNKQFFPFLFVLVSAIIFCH